MDKTRRKPLEPLIAAMVTSRYLRTSDELSAQTAGRTAAEARAKETSDRFGEVESELHDSQARLEQALAELEAVKAELAAAEKQKINEILMAQGEQERQLNQRRLDRLKAIEADAKRKRNR